MSLVAHKAAKGTFLSFLDAEAQKVGELWFPLTIRELPVFQP